MLHLPALLLAHIAATGGQAGNLQGLQCKAVGAEAGESTEIAAPVTETLTYTI